MGSDWVVLNQSDVSLYAYTELVLFSAYRLLIKSSNNGYGKEEVDNWEGFYCGRGF